MESNNGGINIKVDNNNGTMNTAQGNITSTNMVNVNNKSSEESINEICKVVIDLLKKENIDEELKESIVDDIETIQEETNKEEPRTIKIKKAYDNVKKFALKLPEGLIKLTAIATGLDKLISAVSSLFGK